MLIQKMVKNGQKMVKNGKKKKRTEYFLISFLGLAETLPPFWQKVKKKQFFMPPLKKLNTYFSKLLIHTYYRSVFAWML